eukprot:365702-Chlamydomonas_euryale.AAC.15
MSKRSIMRSSSNSSSASALASSVLPTPVGPRNKKPEPRCRDARPARERSTASATAATAPSCPTTRRCSSCFRHSSLSRSLWCSRDTGTPVQRATTAAISSGPTSSVSILPPSSAGARARSAASAASTSGMAPYLRSAMRARSPRCSASVTLTSSASRFSCSLRIESRRSFSAE